MPTRKPSPRLGALLAVAALVCVGCAAGSPQTGAKNFYEEHATAASSIAAATKAVEGEVSSLPTSPTSSQLGTLAGAASQAHTSLKQVSGWKIAGQGEEGAEEEDVPRAETQVAEGAEELLSAMSALGSYARTPRASTLADYKSKLASGSISWNEGISQLWYLAHKSTPPKL
ncbi:MAG: hypothetical protein ABR992_18055 [Solirubrobacteraceae bacterium]